MKEACHEENVSRKMISNLTFCEENLGQTQRKYVTNKDEFKLYLL